MYILFLTRVSFLVRYYVVQGLLELTDGWYSITASLDAPLTRLVAAHRIQVGDKLCICGAELVGPREGAPPLQVKLGVSEGIEGVEVSIYVVSILSQILVV